MTDLTSDPRLACLHGKLQSAEEAVSVIKSGDRVFVGTACGTPRTLVRALESTKRSLHHVQLVHFLTTMAEVAYMILPGWQGVGLGGALQQRMMEYAKSRGLRGFTADILSQNIKMKKLFQAGSPNVSVELSDGTYEVVMLF